MSVSVVVPVYMAMSVSVVVSEAVLVAMPVSMTVSMSVPEFMSVTVFVSVLNRYKIVGFLHWCFQYAQLCTFLFIGCEHVSMVIFWLFF